MVPKGAWDTAIFVEVSYGESGAVTVAEHEVIVLEVNVVVVPVAGALDPVGLLVVLLSLSFCCFLALTINFKYTGCFYF